MFDLDLVLAILHHLIVFALFALIFVELVNVRSGMDATAARRVAAIDAWYGILAALIVFVGFGRAIFAGQGVVLLRTQPVLLGQDQHIRDHRRALDSADAGLPEVAQGRCDADG